MLDAIAMERLGVPAASICTDAFAGSARETCEVQGIPDYPVVMMRHPLSSLDPQAVRERVASAMPEIAAILGQG